jgi:hypothetical protein
MSLDAAVAAGSGILSFIGAERRNEAQEDMANAQMAFQREMSGSAYQRAVADMKKAGINPMLAAKVGGASTPPGAMPQIEDSLSKAVAAGSQTYGQLSSAKLAQEQSDVADVTADKISQETANLKDQNAVIKQTLMNMEELRQNLIKQGFNLDIQANVLRSTVDKLRADTDNTNMQSALRRLDLEAAQDFDNLGREFTQLEPLFKMLIGILRR